MPFVVGKLKAKVGLSSKTPTEAIDEASANLETLATNIQRVRLQLSAYLAQAQLFLGSGAELADSLGTFYAGLGDDAVATTAAPAAGRWAPTPPTSRGEPVGGLRAMYAARGAGPPHAGVAHHTMDAMRSVAGELLVWHGEVTALHANLQSLKYGDLRKKHDYYASKVDGLGDGVMGENVDGANDGAAAERYERNLQKLSDAAKEYYTAMEELVNYADEAMASAAPRMEGAVGRLAALQELLMATLHRLAATAAREAERCMPDGQDEADLQRVRPSPDLSCSAPHHRDPRPATTPPPPPPLRS